MRTLGLWGSIWSRKDRDASPSFGPTFVRSILLWFVALATFRRRRVSMRFENMTDRVKAWSQLTRLEFNRKLEDWYNAEENR